MQARVTVAWKLISVSNKAPDACRTTVFFNQHPNPGLVHQFGADPERTLVPNFLAPTVTFHHWVHRLVTGKIESPHATQRLPYQVVDSDLGSIALKLKCREYFPGILATTVTIDTHDLDLNSPQQLIVLQQLNRNGPIQKYVSAALGLWASGSDGKPRAAAIPRQFPCIDVEVLNRDEYDDLVNKQQSGIVGALIRNTDYQTMDNSIVRDVYRKNAELNKKTTKRVLLVDKQGILQIRSAGESHYTPADLQKMHDLAEMALVFEQLLDQTLSFRGLQPHLTDFALVRLLDWIQIPQAHLSDSVTNIKLWELLSKEFHLEEKARSVSDVFLPELEHKRAAFSRISRWWTLSDLPSAIRNAVHENEGLKFSIIKDQAFRSVIASDLEEAERSLDGRNYKATLILSGSIVEAVLLALHKAAGLLNVAHEKNGSVTFAKAGLADLIYSSRVNKLVKQTATLPLLDSVREYRNLIHPDNQIRNSIIADRHNAEIALRVAKLLVREA
jgi:hypothetical protein